MNPTQCGLLFYTLITLLIFQWIFLKLPSWVSFCFGLSDDSNSIFFIGMSNIQHSTYAKIQFYPDVNSITDKLIWPYQVPSCIGDSAKCENT